MAASFRAAGTLNYGSGSAWGAGTQVASFPAGLTAGDYLLLIINVRGPSANPGLQTPSGWTALATNSADQASLGNEYTGVYGKVATSGDVSAGSVTYTLTTPANAGGFTLVTLAWSGEDQTTPVDVASAITLQASSATPSTPSITTTVNNETIIGIVLLGTSTFTWTVESSPIATTQRLITSPNGKGTTVFDGVKATAGAVSLTGTLGPAAAVTETFIMALKTTPALAAGSITVTSQTATQVGLSISPAGGTTPYTVAWYRFTSQVDAETQNTSNGTLLSGSGSTITDTPPNPGQVYYYNALVTDNASSTSWATAEVAAVTQGVEVVGFVGDSLVHYVPTDGTLTPAAYFQKKYAKFKTGRSVTINNQGHDGAQTTDWLPADPRSTGYLATAKTAFASAGVVWVHVMLGTNDARGASAGAQISQATHTNQLSLIANDLVTAGYKLILHCPPYMVPTNELNGSTLVQAGADDMLYSYRAADMALANGTTIFAGDQDAFAYSAANQATFFNNPDSAGGKGLHPADSGGDALGQLWALAQAKAEGLLPTGGAAGRRRFQ